MFSSDKGFDESGWGTFDTNYDSDAAWDFNPVASKVRVNVFRVGEDCEAKISCMFKDLVWSWYIHVYTV